MDYTTAIIELDLLELPEHPSAAAIMDTAVRKWQDEEAGRWADSREEYPDLSPLASKRVAELTINSTDSMDNPVSKIIPFTSDYAEETSTVRLQVTGSELQALRRDAYWELIRAGRFDGAITKVVIDSLPKARTPRAETTPGRAVTSYRITDERGHAFEKPWAEDHSPLSMPYPTQAAARAAAIEYMSANPRISELAVEGFIQRDTGSAALVTITRSEPETATASFRITTQKPKPNAKITGYLVAFGYHY